MFPWSRSAESRKEGEAQRRGRVGIGSTGEHITLSLESSNIVTMANFSYAHVCLMVLPMAVLLVTAVVAAPAETDVKECDGGHKVNETWVTGPPKVCAEYQCLPDGSISATPCFPMQIGARCKRVEGDKGATFPDCCDRVECVSDGEKHGEEKEEKKDKKEEKHKEKKDDKH